MTPPKVIDFLATPDRARMFAEIAHAGITYNDEVPYTVHLDHVVSVLRRFGFTDSIMICAGYTHDSLEDTKTSYKRLKEKFGEEVAELVFAVTNELGRNRTEKNAKTYPKIQGFDRATALKLADRIANVEYGMATEGGKRDMYVKEYPGFKLAIKVPTEDARIDRMWAHLDLLLAA